MGPFRLPVAFFLGAALACPPALLTQVYQQQDGYHTTPFSLRAPELGAVSKREEPTSRELQQRYEAAAAQAATAWQSAEMIRRNLSGQGMLLHGDTTAALARMNLYLQTASAALQDHDWKYARLSLERAEYMTEKIFRVVGR